MKTEIEIKQILERILGDGGFKGCYTAIETIAWILEEDIDIKETHDERDIFSKDRLIEKIRREERITKNIRQWRENNPNKDIMQSGTIGLLL